MNVILDIIVVAVLALFIILGLKNGLVKSLIGLIGGIVALILAFSLSTPVGNVLGESMIKPTLDSYIADRIAGTQTAKDAKTVEEKLEGVNIDKVLKQPPEYLTNILSAVGTSPAQVTEKISEYKGKLSPAEYTRKMVDTITIPVSRSAGRAIAFVLIFIAVNVGFFFIKFIFGFLNKLPFIKQIDKFGGLLIGIIKGAVLVFVIAFVIKLTMPLFGSMKTADINETTVSDTVLFKAFYNNVKVSF